MTGAGIGWRQTAATFHHDTQMEIVSQDPRDMVYTMIHVGNEVLWETHDGQFMKSTDVGLTRVVQRGALAHIKRGSTTSFGLHASVDVVAKWFGDQVPDGLRPFLRDAFHRSLHSPIQLPTLVIANLKAALNCEGPLRRLSIETAGLQIFTHMLQQVGQETCLESSVDTWHRNCAFEAMNILRQNLENPPQTSEIAIMVGLSTHRLERAFSEVHGMTMRQALVELRFSEACKAILAGEPVKSIAYRLGYSNPSNFIYAFRRRFGQPPKVWREAQVRTRKRLRP